MNGAPDFTQFNRNEVDPYIDQRVRFHGQEGTFRRVNGTPTWMQGQGANFGNGIEDITSRIAPGAGAGQDIVPPGSDGFPAPPSPGPGQAGPSATPAPSGDGTTTNQPPVDPGFRTRVVVGDGTTTNQPSPDVPETYSAFTAAFNSAFGEENYNPRFDFNRDNKIDFADQIAYGGRVGTQPTEVDPAIYGTADGGRYSAETGYMTAEQTAAEQINTNINSLLSTASESYSPEYYSKYKEGYRTYLEGLSVTQRKDKLADPHEAYRDYVIKQLSATPELGNILSRSGSSGGWTAENVNTVAESIASGEGVLSMEYINSIPEELLSGRQKRDIQKVVDGILRPTQDRRTKIQPDPNEGDTGPITVDDEDDGGDSGEAGDPLEKAIDGITYLMTTSGYAEGGEDFLRNQLANDPAGYTDDEIDHIINVASGSAEDISSWEATLDEQMNSGVFDEEATRIQLTEAGYNPNEVDTFITNARYRHEDTQYTNYIADMSEWRDTQLPALLEAYNQTGNIAPYHAALLKWKNDRIALVDSFTQGDPGKVASDKAKYDTEMQAIQALWTELAEPDADADPPPEPGTDADPPPGWVDADGDGYDDNTDMDINGVARTFTQQEPGQFEGDNTKPDFPDTDDTIQNILTYLKDSFESQDGIDNIAANQLNKLSRSAEKAQEQLMEDLNRLGLAGMETGDAQAAMGEFKGALLAQQSQIRADSDLRIADNIDRLITVAGLEVTKEGQDERIKMLQESIKSKDQLALFNGLLDILGPGGMDMLGGFGGGDGGGAGGAGGAGGGGAGGVPEGLWGIEGLDTSKLSGALDDDGNAIEGMFAYTNAAGDMIHVPEDFDVMTDPGAITLRNMGYSNADIMEQMAATKPPKWFDKTKMKQAAGFLAAGELASQVLPGVAGSIAKGASQGAAIGSVVPVIGTGIGAAIGAGIAAATNFLGINMSGHNDRQVESSWHPAVLDVLYQNGFTPRDKVSKEVLDEIATQLNIPFTGPNSEAFRRSSHYKGADVEKQDKIWFEAYENGTLSREDFITRSLASSVGNSGIDLKTWSKKRKYGFNN